MQDFPIIATPSLDDAILNAVRRAIHLQMAGVDPLEDARAVVGGIARSKSALGATHIVDAIWRVGWPKIQEAVEEVAAAAFQMGPENVERAGGLGAAALLQAEASFGMPAEMARAYVSKSDDGAFFILGEVEEAHDTITGYRCVVEVISCGDGGEWRILDAMEADDAEIPDAIHSAKSTLLPMCTSPARDLVTVPVAMADFSAAVGSGEEPGVADPAALARCVTALAERLCSIGDVEGDIASLTCDLAPAPWRVEVEQELEYMEGAQSGLAALAEGARSASASHREGGRDISDGSR